MSTLIESASDLISEGLDYEVIPGWGTLPAGWKSPKAAGVVVDSKDRVIVLCIGEHPIIVFSRGGEFIESWGESLFTSAHGAYIDQHDSLFCVDSADNTVRKFSKYGELVLTLGVEDVSNPDGKPFNKPTDIATASNGELYVSDGYGASRIYRFTPDGEMIQSWGEPGSGPGQFNVPHGIWVDGNRVLVGDRENNRIQIFDREGIYSTEWTDLHSPCDIYFDKRGRIYVAELQHRISILNQSGKALARLGGVKSFDPGRFIAPHCVWKDSYGGLYVGEMREGNRIQKFIPK